MSILIMQYIQIILVLLLSLVLSNNNIISAESASTPEENTSAQISTSEQPKQTKTWDDILRESSANWKPLPGSHYDENYRVIIDDPEIYQKALEKENSTVERNFSVQPKQVKSKQEARNASSAKWKPLPGSHFDENYHVVIDDPEVYQKALEKEQAQNEGKFDYQNIKPQEDPREQNIFYRLYKYNPILGILATIPLVCLAVVLLRFRDSLRKKKE